MHQSEQYLLFLQPVGPNNILIAFSIVSAHFNFENYLCHIEMKL